MAAEDGNTVKTIVHIELSDEERNDLARRLERRDTKRLVTRRDVQWMVSEYINQEIEDGRKENFGEETGFPGDTEANTPVEEHSLGADPRGEALTEHADEARASVESSPMPSWSELNDACKKVLAHIDENKPTDTVNVGWCISVLAATGAI